MAALKKSLGAKAPAAKAAPKHVAARAKPAKKRAK
jgi:hypothetical protein